MTATRSKNRGLTRERTPFEWAVLGCSVVATFALMAGLILGSFGTAGSADLRVTIDARPIEASGGAAFDISVFNAGGTSAESVLIEVVSGSITRELSLELVAKGDTEHAFVVFPSSAAESPRATVVSYAEP